MRKTYLVLALLVLFTVAVSINSHINAPVYAQEEKPLMMPVAEPPGPSTWLMGQPYGNTVGAYNFGSAWYSAGQGLHFGIDLSMPCGTPLVAVADGQVVFTDNLSFGSGPHNLLIRHDDAEVVSLYGHLLEQPSVQVGQTVTKGEVVALSGDPDVTCVSRPHLHLELRSLNYGTTYNPVDYIEANWHNLAIVGGFSYPLFAADLNNSRRWMSLEDQPDVVFGGQRLNAYNAVHPLSNDKRPIPNTSPARDLPEPDASWTLKRMGEEGCCRVHWWHPNDPNTLFSIDGGPSQRASVIQWDAAAGTYVGAIDTTPPPSWSPDGRYLIWNRDNIVSMTDTETGIPMTLFTSGVTPTINPTSTMMLWVTRATNGVPGQGDPPSTIWVSDINGNNGRFILSGAGLNARWLDEHRILVSTPGEGRDDSLGVYDLRDASQYTLGTWTNMRGLSIAPGGGRIMFYLTFQEDPANNSIYVMETAAEAVPQKIEGWFGGWRWYDAESVYYIPLEPEKNVQTLHHYNVVTGEDRVLTDPETLPFAVMNGDWEVSADGRRIVFQNAADSNMWVLEMGSVE